MNYKKGDIIYNNSSELLSLQWVKLLSDVEPNYERGVDGSFRHDYPYKATVLHVKGAFTGEIVDNYYIFKNSILIKRSEEFFSRIVKPFEFV